MLSPPKVRPAICTCVPSADVVPHVGLLHAHIVTDAAAEREHPLLLVHMERHVADKLGIQLRLETTHMAAGQRTERKRVRMRGGRRAASVLDFPCKNCQMVCCSYIPLNVIKTAEDNIQFRNSATDLF